MITFVKVVKQNTTAWILNCSTVHLPDEVIVKYPHYIEGIAGFIDVPFSIGDKVYKHPSTQERSYDKIGTIKNFDVVGGVICARFEETNVPHDIECLSLVGELPFPPF